MGKKLFRDLDEFIEGGGREIPDEPQNEGNIDSQDENRPDEAEQRGNIDPREEERPQPPDRSSIEPRGDRNRGDRDQSSIPKSDRAPDEPKRRGNIQPREFNEDKGEFERDQQEPNVRGNIDSREEERPEEPRTSGNIDSRGEERLEDVEPEGNIDSREENRPQIPDREGIIEPRDFNRPDDSSSRGNIGSREEERPEDTETEGNISSREEEKPGDAETEGNIETREDEKPTDARQEDNISTREEERPEDTETEGNISAREEEKPEDTETEGNIETREDERPEETSREGNISAREEERPEDTETEGNVETREDERPEEPETEGNISTREEERPEDARTEGNIDQRPEERPEEPDVDNISTREENRPEDTETEGNIDTQEENRPEEPNVDRNIEARDEERPKEPDTENNIQTQEENRPEEPSTDDNIQTQEENRPEDPETEGNIDTQEENRPGSPETEGNIEGREENRPEDTDTEGNIDTQEENRPETPETEGNIEDRDENRPEDTETEGNISTREGERPEDTDVEGNIDQRLENRPEEFPGSRPRGRGEDDIDRLNREERLETFERFFTIAQDQGAPFVLRRPEEGGGSSVVANLKQGDSREAPVGSVAEDTVRIGRFLGSPRGLLYNARQQFLQQQNPRRRTRIYDPSSLPSTAAVGMTDRPGLGITRHLDGGGVLGSAASALFDVPESSRFEDELEDRAIQTEWGEMTGNLFWLSPVAQTSLPDVKGQEARARVQERLEEQSSNVLPITSTADKESLAAFGAAFALRQLTGYLFTQDYDPEGGPDGGGESLVDTYHPGSPYVLNVERVHDRDSFGPEGFVASELGDQATSIIDIVGTIKSDGAPFPFHDPERTLSQTERAFGDGTVRTLMQNKSTRPEVFHENRVTRSDVGDRPTTPLHRGIQGNNESRGLPNYSIRAGVGDEESTPQKYLDLINAEPPAIGSDVNLEAEAFGPEENQYSDLIPFKFIDIPNKGRIVFRAFLEGISDNLSPEWSQEGYSGRPEEAHRYGGYSNTISFSFQVVPFSETEFEVMWEKLNYLKGLTTPAQYNPARGGGSFMVPPFLRLTIGDMFNDVFGYINSLTISVNDDMDWEINPDVGRLPRGIEVDVDWYVIQKRVPVARQKFYDAPFLDERSRSNATSQPPEPVDPVDRGETDPPPREASPNLSDVAEELVGEGGSYPQFDKDAGTPDSSRTDPELRTP